MVQPVCEPPWCTHSILLRQVGSTFGQAVELDTCRLRPEPQHKWMVMVARCRRCIGRCCLGSSCCRWTRQSTSGWQPRRGERERGPENQGHPCHQDSRLAFRCYAACRLLLCMEWVYWDGFGRHRAYSNRNQNGMGDPAGKCQVLLSPRSTKGPDSDSLDRHTSSDCSNQSPVGAHGAGNVQQPTAMRRLSTPSARACCVACACGC